MRVGSHGRFLEFGSRLDIAIDVAHGVNYLHKYSDHPIIHRDIKSSNILLTSSLRAKVADFGFARLGAANFASHVSTQVKGTAGYLDPEYLKTCTLTDRSDVYSFGVLLLEMLTGKAPTNAVLHDEGVDLPRWARSVVREEWTSEVFDTELLRHPGAEEEMVEMLRLAMDCTVPVPEQRPAMPEIVVRIDELGGPASSGHSMSRPGRSVSVDEADDRPLKPAGSIRDS